MIIKISLSLDHGHLRPESVLRGDSDEYKLKIQLDVSLKVMHVEGFDQTATCTFVNHFKANVSLKTILCCGRPCTSTIRH